MRLHSAILQDFNPHFMAAASEALPACAHHEDAPIIHIAYPLSDKYFMFDPAQYRLTFELDHESKCIDLGYAGSRLLQRLLQRPGEVVSREDLMEYAWPGRVVGQGSLNQQIYALRRLLGDEGGREIIQTVPRRGYQFNTRYLGRTQLAADEYAHATLLASASTSTALTLSPAHLAPGARRQVWMNRAALIVLACAAIFAALFPQTAPTPAHATSPLELGRAHIVVDVVDQAELEPLTRHLQQLAERLSAATGAGLRITLGREGEYFELYCERTHQPISWLVFHRSRLSAISEYHLRRCLY